MNKTYTEVEPLRFVFLYCGEENRITLSGMGLQIFIRVDLCAYTPKPSGNRYKNRYIYIRKLGHCTRDVTICQKFISQSPPLLEHTTLEPSHSKAIICIEK